MTRSFRNLVIILAAMCGLMACVPKQQQQQEQQQEQEQPDTPIADLPLPSTIQKRLAEMDTLPVLPKGLTDFEKIIWLENHVLTSPITAEELLALTPIHDLDPDMERFRTECPEAYMEKVAMVNRFMRMQFVALGAPMDELQWVKAVQQMLAEYAASHSISEANALDSLAAGVRHLEAGTQYQMNQWTYVLASVEYCKTLSLYRTLIDDRTAQQKEMFRQEYIAWNQMNKARHNAYVYIRRAGDHYSSLPMEYEAVYAAYATYRRELLELEDRIIRGREDYTRQHPLVRDSDWEDYLDTRLYRVAADEDSTLVSEVDQSVRTWLQMRQRIAKNLHSGARESYDNLTNDYYWTIIHEAEPLPEEYF